MYHLEVTGKVGVVYNNFFRMFNVIQKRDTQYSEENDLLFLFFNPIFTMHSHAHVTLTTKNTCFCLKCDVIKI